MPVLDTFLGINWWFLIDSRFWQIKYKDSRWTFSNITSSRKQVPNLSVGRFFSDSLSTYCFLSPKFPFSWTVYTWHFYFLFFEECIVLPTPAVSLFWICAHSLQCEGQKRECTGQATQGQRESSSQFSLLLFVPHANIFRKSRISKNFWGEKCHLKQMRTGYLYGVPVLRSSDWYAIAEASYLTIKLSPQIPKAKFYRFKEIALFSVKMQGTKVYINMGQNIDL